MESMTPTIQKHDLKLLYRYCLSLSNDKDNAFDLLQCGIEKWLKASVLEPRGMAYLRKIIRNQFVDEYRRGKVLAFEPLNDLSHEVSNAEQSIEQMMIDEQDVAELMKKLTSVERETLFLWAVMEFSAAEIASEIGEPRGTILSRLHRIKLKANASGHQDSAAQGAV
ncbi:MAG: RNA polymerase sigma-70 factor (ECF subfamily) [Paraglaciecola sp.]|jgi:RNA polymerase sigma-70 factor (ECF subfamily)